MAELYQKDEKIANLIKLKIEDSIKEINSYIDSFSVNDYIVKILLQNVDKAETYKKLQENVVSRVQKVKEYIEKLRKAVSMIGEKGGRIISS